MVWKLGIDTGGTFTDCVLLDDKGEYSLSKVPSDVRNPTGVFTAALSSLAEARGLTIPELLGRIGLVLYGTTIAVNALLQAKGAKTGLICTKGFRDILEHREGYKGSDDYFFPLPPILVPRHLRIGVEERIGADGEVVVPLKETDVLDAIAKFKREEVQAVAVCFLHSYRNPTHEKRVRQILERELPGAYLSISHEVLPLFREYDRTSTAVVNAGLGPTMDKHIEDFEGLLRSLGYEGEVRYMQANAGITSGDVLRKKPVLSISSGPAAGVVAGSFFASLLQKDNLITVDMGGTSLDTCLIRRGNIDIRTRVEVGRFRVGISSVNVNSIGAGGGSIAWIDSGGMLRVGPKSAEASPGPACYDKGGTEPTVSDAHVVLGHFNPEYLLGGKLRINKDASFEAIRRKVADPLTMSVPQAALGILRITDLNMADAIRMISLARGEDPRGCILVSAGGGGPAHAAALARELNIPSVIVPKISSFFCAFGALVSKPRHDYGSTMATNLYRVDCDRLSQLFDEFEEKAYSDLGKEGVSREDIQFQRSLDMRYEGEIDECSVPIARQRVTREYLPEIAEAFHRVHEDLYTFRDVKSTAVLVNARLTAFGPQPEVKLVRRPFVGCDPCRARIGTRNAMFEEERGYEQVPVYDGARVGVGNVIVGPAIVEEETTTVLVSPGARLELDGRDFYTMTFVS